MSPDVCGEPEPAASSLYAGKRTLYVRQALFFFGSSPVRGHFAHEALPTPHAEGRNWWQGFVPSWIDKQPGTQ